MSHTRSTRPLDAHGDCAWISRFDAPLRLEPNPATDNAALQGLTFAVKDNIDVAGVPTTAACPEFAHTPTAHATVVQRLLQAGASLLGKTNLDQFACGLNGTRSPYGAVPNAIDPTYVSGGSSSGSAYVVATGQVDFALGTDTAGSGRVPAGLNHIVGFKPSRGRISAAGVLPAAQSVDVVSIFARSVPLAWKVLMAAAGPDRQDPFSRSPQDLPWRARPFAARPRMGVPDELHFYGDSAAQAAFEQALQRLREMGAQLVSIPYAPLARAAELLYGSALVAERHAAIRGFFDAHETAVIEPVRSIIGQARQYSATDLFEAQLALRQIEQQVRPMWQDIDLMVVPTAPTHVRIDDMLRQPVELNRQLGHYTNFVNLLDYAALSVPSGWRQDGLPFGVTFMAPAGADWPLAEWGTRYHARSHAETPAHPPCIRLDPENDFLAPTPPGPAWTCQSETLVAVVGAHLSGMPLNGQLTERGARLVERSRTAPLYQLFALNGTRPPKPGLVRVGPEQGHAIEIEVWALPTSEFGSFVTDIPAPLSMGTLILHNNQSVQGFLCEAWAVDDAIDISHHGGWRNYVATARQE
jgi:allophanate hydrolase